MSVMPKSRLKLPPLKLATEETFGKRLARIRKERGLTQTELAERMGLIQSLITNYERDRLRMHAEIVIRFALALGVSTDVLLGFPKIKSAAGARSMDQRLSLKVVRRVQRIEKLPPLEQKAVLRSIDLLLGGVPSRDS